MKSAQRSFVVKPKSKPRSTKQTITHEDQLLEVAPIFEEHDERELRRLRKQFGTLAAHEEYLKEKRNFFENYVFVFIYNYWFSLITSDIDPKQ